MLSPDGEFGSTGVGGETAIDWFAAHALARDLIHQRYLTILDCGISSLGIHSSLMKLRNCEPTQLAMPFPLRESNAPLRSGPAP